MRRSGLATRPAMTAAAVAPAGARVARGIGFALVSYACFSTSDAIIKLASARFSVLDRLHGLPGGPAAGPGARPRPGRPAGPAARPLAARAGSWRLELDLRAAVLESLRAAAA